MRRTHAAVALSAGLALSAGAYGQSKTWDGEGGNLDWFDGSNWDPDGVPEAADSVLLAAGGPVRAESQAVEVQSLEVLSGLEIISSGLSVVGSSRIVGLRTGGCCIPVVEHSATLSIEGVSFLEKGARFDGSGTTTIGGSSVCVGSLQARDTHEVVIAGDMLLDSAWLQPWSAGTIRIEGTVTGGTGSNVGYPGVAEVVNRGTVQITAPGTMQLQGIVRTEGAGVVRADSGVIELLGACHFDGGSIEASNGGSVELLMGADCEVRDVSMSGDGEVYVQTGRAVLLGTCTAGMSYPGTMLIRNPLQVGGTVRNTGSMTLFGATLRNTNGMGKLETTGFVDVQLSSRVEIPVEVQGGGTLQPRAALGVADVVTVESGGQLSFSDVGVELTVPGGTSGALISAGQIRLDPSLGTYSGRQSVVVHPPLELRPTGEVKVLGGYLSLRGGGQLIGGVFNLDQDGTGMVLRGDGLTWAVSGEPVAQGVGSLTLGGGGALTTIDLAGTFRVNLTPPNDIGLRLEALLRGQGELVNEGMALIEDGSYRGFRLESTLRNTGMLQFTASFDNAGTIVNGGSVVSDSSSTIDFEGGHAVNDGTWTFPDSASASNYNAVPSGTFGNNHVFEAIGRAGNNHGHRIYVAFTNNGRVRAADAGFWFYDCANLSAGVLTGGAWTVEGGGWILFPNQAVHTIGPGTRVEGGPDSTPWAEDVSTVRGDLAVGDGTGFHQAVEVRDGGVLRVKDGLVSAPKFDASGGGTIELTDGAAIYSTGEIEFHSVIDDIEGVVSQGLLPAAATIETPLLTMGGRMIPGGEGRAGQMDVVGQLFFMPGAELLVDVGGVGNTDVVTSTGPTVLDETTLRVTLIDEHQPQAGDSYELVAATGGLSGSVGTLDLPALGGGLGWEVGYTSTGLVLRVIGGGPCVADWNGDGMVNTIDFLSYLGDWSAGDPAADLNGDGVVNTIDFLAYLGLWSAGC